ncbi:hypothetical protein B296_00034923, partial [Ensete ventricosum]
DENRPSTAEIDRRQPILAVPPDSSRSAYRSTAGPVCTGRYGSYRSTSQKVNLGTVLANGRNLASAFVRVEQGTSCSARRSSPKGMVVSETSNGRNARGKLLQLDRYPGGISPSSLEVVIRVVKNKWCIMEIMLVGDRGPRSRQWSTNSSEYGKSEDKAKWSKGARKRRRVRRGLATQKAKCRLEKRWTRRSGIVPQRRIYRSHQSLALIEGERWAEEVENAEANSKYQDKAEGQRLRNFIKLVSMVFSLR